MKLSVLKQADANTVEVAKAVNKKIEELQQALPAGIQLGMVENQADYIEAALAGVRNAALEGAFLVIFIVYVFLGSWRQALVMALALPITMVLNFKLMKIAGFSLNIFSLGGLVVAIAVVLDNSIVVIENITRLKHESPNDPSAKTAVKATAEVGPAIIAATLSFIAIFVPFLLVPGLVSLLFRELILVIAGVVTISLLTAVTLAPMLTTILLGEKSHHEEDTRFQRFFFRGTERYGEILKKVLRGRWIAAGASVLVLACGAFVIPRVGTEFLPRMDDGPVMIKVRLPTGASVHETDQALRKIESLIANDPLIESYFTLVGGKVWRLYTYQIANEGEIDIQLVPRHERALSTQQYVANMRPVVAKVGIPGGMAMVMPLPVKGIRKLGDADIEVKIKGQDIKELFDLARKTSNAMTTLAHFTNVYVSMDMTKPEYQIHVDRERSAELGVSIDDVANTVRSLVQGAVATRFRDGDRYYNVRVVVPERDIKSKEDVEHLVLQCAQGGYLRVRDLADVRPAVGPVEIVREDQVKAVVVRGDAAGVTVG